MRRRFGQGSVDIRAALDDISDHDQHLAMRPLRFRTTPLPMPGAPTSARASYPQATLASTIALWRQAWPDRRGGAQPVAPDSNQRVAAVLRHRFGGDEAAWSIARDLHGRPALAAAHGLDISISHAGNCWLLAVSSAGRRIGVDIEKPRPLPRALALAERYFPASEVVLLSRLAPSARARAFLRLWCAREAILKAHGRGIAFGLSRLRFELTPNRIHLLDCDAELGEVKDWRLREFVPQCGMIGMLAWQGPPAVVRGLP